MKISARNQLKGTVKSIERGPVNSTVEVNIGDQVVTAMITTASVDSLGLAEGKTAYVLIKASSVMLGAD
jgi:molybdopterin-binding protein